MIEGVRHTAMHRVRILSGELASESGGHGFLQLPLLMLLAFLFALAIVELARALLRPKCRKWLTARREKKEMLREYETARRIVLNDR